MRIQKDYFNFIYSLAVKTVQDYFNSVSEISTENNKIKTARLVNSRRMVYVLIKEGIPTVSCIDIAKAFKKTHATILYNLKKHKDLVEVDNSYKKDFNEVYSMFVSNNGIRDIELDRYEILTNPILRLFEERRNLKNQLLQKGKIK